MNKCTYCGREATKQFKNGKWCCSESRNSCPAMIAKNRAGQKDVWTDEKRDEVRQRMKGNQYKKGVKHTEEFKQFRSDWMKANNPMNNEQSRKHVSESKIGVKNTKLSDANKRKKQYRIEHGIGHNGTLHKYAWELFGKYHCEICGISNDEYKTKFNHRLSMHCRSKEYNDLSEDNWVTVCEFGCHQKLDALDRI